MFTIYTNRPNITGYQRILSLSWSNYTQNLQENDNLIGLRKVANEYVQSQES